MFKLKEINHLLSEYYKIKNKCLYKKGFFNYKKIKFYKNKEKIIKKQIYCNYICIYKL